MPKRTFIQQIEDAENYILLALERYCVDLNTFDFKEIFSLDNPFFTQQIQQKLKTELDINSPEDTAAIDLFFQVYLDLSGVTTPYPPLYKSGILYQKEPTQEDINFAKDALDKIYFTPNSYFHKIISQIKDDKSLNTTRPLNKKM